MAKKKQLNGKKTKLDKLPLTQALSKHLEEQPPVEVGEEAAAAGAGVEPRQLPLSWERLEEGAAGLLTAAYVLLVKDLLSLQEEIPWAGEELLTPEEIIPAVAPPAPRVKQALRLAREELSALSRLLS
uniref:Uncharacterized protein n=1 Tax=Desulfobacca acetoxidans TaxID=60893 RepID=A0A7V4LDW7_9BACT